jgi:uncharacterized protein (DUF58 family)
MSSSRVVLSPWGWSWIAGGAGGLLIGILTLNLVLLVVPTAAIAFVAAELIAFDRATRDFGTGWFRWQRFENSSQVPLDGLGTMAIDLELLVPRAFYAEIFDSPPDTFEVVGGSPKLRTWWRRAGSLRLAYLYRPRERGEFRLGPTTIVAHQPLGLASRTATLENRWEVLVTPSLTVEDAQARLSSAQRDVGEAFWRRSGPGTEFRALHEYDPMDDVRRIAWRRSANERIYVVEHEEEVHPDVLVIVDCGRDMRLGRPGSESLELSIDGATVLVGAALARSDRVGLLVVSNVVEDYLPVRANPETGPEFTEALGRIHLSPNPFRLDAALQAAAERLLTPTTIVLFSNLAELPKGAEASVATVRGPGHRLLVLSPDYAELYPPQRDRLAEETFAFLREPARLELDAHLDRLRDAGAPVAVYPASAVRVAVVAAYREILTGGDRR